MERRESKIQADAFIVYLDRKGQLTERNVSFLKIIEKDTDVYVTGICRERRAPRLFKVEKIELLIDSETGAGYTDAHVFFRKFVKQDFVVQRMDSIAAVEASKRRKTPFVRRFRLLRMHVPLVRG